MPYPPIDGGAQLMHFTTRGLLENNIYVKILSINPTRNFIDINTLPDDYKISTRFENVKIDTHIKPGKFFINLLREESYFIERFLSKNFEQKIQSILESEDFDIVQLEHLYLCKYIKAIRAYTNAKVILRPQNVEYIIWESYRKGVKNPVTQFFLNIAISRLKEFEQNLNDQLDGIIALTKEDADIFSSFSNKTPVRVVPMGYDYEKLNGYDYEEQYSDVPVVYHLASMDWLPNVEAVRWFFTKVFPIIEKQKISITFSIAGKGMPSWVYKYNAKNIEILGEITNPLAYQKDKSIMMVPLWSGSGIRAKIIEGLALGKTIISTSIGAQGIEYENGKNILIADTPAEFALQIIRCVCSLNLCKEIGQNARELGLNYYHYKNTAKKMIGFYNQLLGAY